MRLKPIRRAKGKQLRAALRDIRTHRVDMDPVSTPEGQLPPLEVLKAVAFNDVIEEMEKHTGKTCWELLGTSKKKIHC